MTFLFKFFLFVALSLGFGSSVSAEDLIAQRVVETPAEFKDFFEEVAQLAKKYPAARARFGIVDRKGVSLKPDGPLNHASATSRWCGAGQCCSEWHDEGSHLVCDRCSWCLP